MSKPFKVYRPNSFDKFRGQNNGNVIEGYNQLPKNGLNLIITSSLKDVLTLNKAGYCACSPTSENSHRVLLNKTFELNQRFKYIYVLFDSDAAGISSAKKLCRQTGWKFLQLPYYRIKIKDPSDLVMKYKNYFWLKSFLNDNIL